MLTVYLTGALVTAFWTWHYEQERMKHRATILRTRHFDFRTLKIALAITGSLAVGLAWFITLPSALFTHLFTEPHG